MKFETVSRLAIVAVCGTILTVGAAGIAAAADDPPPDGALRETATCLDCHDDMAASLARSPHAVLDGEEMTRVTCTACHTGTAAHFEDDPEENPMANPANLDVTAAAAVCAGCHMNEHQENQATLSPHAIEGVTCLTCHQVHGSRLGAGLKQEQTELCFSCHMAQRGEFAKPYSHPVRDGGFMNCADCHLAGDDRMAPMTMKGWNDVCLNCHREFQGPFPHDHQAAVDYSVEEGGCIACHEPHGSYVPRLLNQPYEAPQFQLCSQCHIVPRHRYNSHHGSDWAGVACNECHVDIHGSYDNQYFLSRALEGQGCFAAGCHSR